MEESNYCTECECDPCECEQYIEIDVDTALDIVEVLEAVFAMRYRGDDPMSDVAVRFFNSELDDIISYLREELAEEGIL